MHTPLEYSKNKLYDEIFYADYMGKFVDHTKNNLYPPPYHLNVNGQAHMVPFFTETKKKANNLDKNIPDEFNETGRADYILPSLVAQNVLFQEKLKIC